MLPDSVYAFLEVCSSAMALSEAEERPYYVTQTTSGSFTYLPFAPDVAHLQLSPNGTLTMHGGTPDRTTLRR